MTGAKHLPTLLLAAIAGVTSALPATADDLDVFRANLDAQRKPNIMFVLDYSGSMGRDVNGDRPSDSGLESRISILKRAVTQVVDANLDTMNAGIASMYALEPSGVRWPASDLRGDASELDPTIPPGTTTNRDVIVSQLERVDSGGGTSTVDALAEAALYFQGRGVSNGNGDPLEPLRHQPDVWDPVLQAYAGGHSKAALPAAYAPRDAFKTNQPLSNQIAYCHDDTASGGSFDNCSVIPPNLILSCETVRRIGIEHEGVAYSLNNVERCSYRTTANWAGANYDSPIDSECGTNAIMLVSDGVPTRLQEDGAVPAVLGAPVSSCENLANTTFANTDQTDIQGNCGIEIARHLASTPQIPGITHSTVNTFTVGFALDGAGAKYLDDIATAGGGTSTVANDIDELVQALSDQVNQIANQDESFVELAIDIDRANFSHNDRAYFSLFKPTNSAGWIGNLKGYYMTADGLKDVHGNDVVNPTGTGFAEDIRSFWSSALDGNRVEEGGASEQMIAPNTPRNLYTVINYDGGRANLAGNPQRALDTGNNRITPAVMGTQGNPAQRDAALDWVQTAPMGDPLHTRPVAVQYESGEVVFTMSNQGFLHAIDASSPGDLGGVDFTGGDELFAFMPERLLRNLPTLMSGADSDEHVYGLDGGITRIHDDTNNDGIVNGGETITLVIGMRRGGDSYYALDVTNPRSPALVWTIDPETAGFAHLGETWSKMAMVRGASRNGTEEFLVFSGGYDAANLDDTAAPTQTSRGNALYVTDLDGNYVWSVDGRSEPDMRYAIAADPTIIDSDGDGLADRLYVGDLGGQIWRIDFDNMRSAADYTVTRLAALSNGAADHQPFFYSPSIALNRDAGSAYLSVALGSGDRTDPMNLNSANRFTVLRDENVAKGAPSSDDLITLASLYDATDNLISSNDPAVAGQARDELAASEGWFVSLNPGEKSLSRVVTFEGRLLATTFEPMMYEAADCGHEPIGRYYQMDIATGAPGFLSNSTAADQSTASRFKLVPTSSIPSSPTVVFPEGTGLTQIFVGLERVEQIETGLSRVYWHAR